jgi:cytochrome o ubiquinol oxidase subunit 1
MMNYANLFWLFGHPEVYLLILPAFGIYSEVIATFSGKRLFGYMSLVVATMAISVLSFTVWLHHFFTMGQGANVNVAFGIATMFIAVPTGVKVYDWMLTMYRGRIRMTVPMIYASGFLVLFVIGGLTGVILANPTIDYQVHNTLFLVAHFHNVLVPGVLFAMLAGWHYWFPKMFGFRLDEKWGRISALLWIPGFALTFFPLYVAGLMGMPRRSVTYSNPALEPYMIAAAAGAAIILCAVAALGIQFAVSMRDRDRNRVTAGDPWNGRTLEWSVSAPPPEYNFAILPQVAGRDAFAAAKEEGTAYRPVARFSDIELPRNTWLGAFIGAYTVALGFALVFHIWWLASLSLLAVIAAPVVDSFDIHGPRIVSAHEVERDYLAWLEAVRAAGAVTRDAETTAANNGLAAPETLEGYG